MREFFIIADIGSNHRSDIDIATKQIERAAECGVNAVKFQYYSELELYGSGSARPSIQDDYLEKLKTICDENKVEFMCSAFSAEGIAKLDPLVKRHKIASCEMKDPEISKAAFKTGKQVIVSTGAAHFEEIEKIIHQAKISANKELCLLECVAAYPAHPMDYNLTTIPRYIEMGIKTGISDHTVSLNLVQPAVQFGATVFEVHADLVKGAATPDTPVSLDYSSLSRYREYVYECANRHHKDMLKRPAASEREITMKYRRRLKVTKELPVNTKLVYRDNYGSYRSSTDDAKAHAPEEWQKYDGKICRHAKKVGDPLYLDDI